MPYLVDIQTSFPENYYTQEELIEKISLAWKGKIRNISRVESIHSNVLVEGRHLAVPIEDFFKLHSKFKILPSDSSHLQLVEEGIDFALTMYGTVGLEYAAMNKPVINASLNNPHIAYDFNINPKSRKEYSEILMNLKDVKHNINLNEVYEYYYMKHLHYNHNWLFNNFVKFTDHFGSHKERLSSDVYLYWIEGWSEARHKEILENLNKFIVSGEYRLIS